MDRSLAWWRSDRAAAVADGALVALVVAVGWAGMIAARSDDTIEATPFGAAMAVMSVVAALPLLGRRRWPLASLAAAIGAVVVASSIDERGLFAVQVVLEAGVLCFAIGAWSTRPRFSLAVLIGLMLALVLGAVADDTSLLAAGAYVATLVALPAVLGYAARTRRDYVAEVEARLAAAERDRDERARQAVIDERTRIARELHDVVAHHVSLIGVQAGAARTALERSPDATRSALEAIESSSRAAVGEMRQLLDALAPIGEASGAVPPAPQPSLERIPDLVTSWRTNGVDVEATFVGDPTPVAPTVSLCAYRVVEEALTNVARHSAAGRVRVAIAVGGEVRVEVRDPGPARSEPTTVGGRGLVGMRERVALCGGSLTAASTLDGGFLVSATLPVGAS